MSAAPTSQKQPLCCGDDGGDGAQTSTVLAGSTRSITQLVDGGEIRRLVAVAGSGPTANALTAGLAGSESDERAQAALG